MLREAPDLADLQFYHDAEDGVVAVLVDYEIEVGISWVGAVRERSQDHTSYAIFHKPFHSIMCNRCGC